MQVIRAPQQGPSPGAAHATGDPPAGTDRASAASAPSAFLALLALLGTLDSDAGADSASVASPGEFAAMTENGLPAKPARSSDKATATSPKRAARAGRAGQDHAPTSTRKNGEPDGPVPGPAGWSGAGVGPALPFGVPVIINPMPVQDTPINRSSSGAPAISAAKITTSGGIYSAPQRSMTADVLVGMAPADVSATNIAPARDQVADDETTAISAPRTDALFAPSPVRGSVPQGPRPPDTSDVRGTAAGGVQHSPAIDGMPAQPALPTAQIRSNGVSPISHAGVLPDSAARLTGANTMPPGTEKDGVTGVIIARQPTTKAIAAQVTMPPEHAMRAGKIVRSQDISGATMTGTEQHPVATTTGIPSADASSTAKTDVHPAAVQTSQQIVAQAALLHNGQTTEMQLRLRPPELGEVRITLRRDAGGVISAHLVPATQEAGAILNANLHHLRQTLNQQSTGGRAEVSVGHRDAADHHQHANQGRHLHEDDTTSPIAPAATANNAQATAASRRSHHAGQAGASVDYDA